MIEDNVFCAFFVCFCWQEDMMILRSK